MMKQENMYFTSKFTNRKKDPNGFEVKRIETEDKRTTHWIEEVNSLRIRDNLVQ